MSKRRNWKNRYTVMVEGNANHNHSYEKYELVKTSGIVFCDWQCECGRVVSDHVGEAINPTGEM